MWPKGEHVRTIWEEKGLWQKTHCLRVRLSSRSSSFLLGGVFFFRRDWRARKRHSSHRVESKLRDAKTEGLSYTVQHTTVHRILDRKLHALFTCLGRMRSVYQLACILLVSKWTNSLYPSPDTSGFPCLFLSDLAAAVWLARRCLGKQR
jgi:hypothetical protein